MMSKAFWLSVLVRAIKTAAQVAVATIGIGATSLADVPWTGVLSVSGLAALLSVLTSIIAYGTPVLPQVDPIGVLSDKVTADTTDGADPAPDSDVKAQVGEFMDESHRQEVSTDPGPGVPDPNRNIANPEGDF